MDADAADVVLRQLKTEHKWYDSAAQKNNWMFLSLKAVQIVAARSSGRSERRVHRGRTMPLNLVMDKS
jgi:hypothetical protein